MLLFWPPPVQRDTSYLARYQRLGFAEELSAKKTMVMYVVTEVVAATATAAVVLAPRVMKTHLLCLVVHSSLAVHY